MNDHVDIDGKPIPDPTDWGRAGWRQPTPLDGEGILHREPGRILPGADGRPDVDCRSHSFAIVRDAGGRALTLLVRHGGGQQRIPIDHSGRLEPMLASLDPDARYWLCLRMLDVADAAARGAASATGRRYREAFVEGRLKKSRRGGAVEVTIAPRTVAAVPDATRASA